MNHMKPEGQIPVNSKMSWFKIHKYFNCSIFIFYFQKLSFSNKSQQTLKEADYFTKMGLSLRLLIQSIQSIPIRSFIFQHDFGIKTH